MWCSALYNGISTGRKKCHPDVSQSRRPTSDCMSLSGTLVQSVNLCNCCTILERFSSGIEIDQVSTEIRHPIQSTSTSKAALCHDMGMPKMRKRTTKSEAQRGDGNSVQPCQQVHPRIATMRGHAPEVRGLHEPSIQQHDPSTNHWLLPQSSV